MNCLLLENEGDLIFWIDLNPLRKTDKTGSGSY